LVANDKHDAPVFSVFDVGAARPRATFDVGVPLRKVEDLTASRRHPGRIYAIGSFEGRRPADERLVRLSVHPTGALAFALPVEVHDPKAFLAARDGRAYAKVEALALSPDEKALVMGVRAAGPDAATARKGVTLLAYDAKRPEDAPRLLADVDLAPLLGRPEGISALEWAPRLGAWLLTTSFEGQGEGREDVGGHLWVVRGPLERLGQPGAWAELPRVPFAHKPEGVTELSDGRVLVAFDDDDERKDPNDPSKLPLERPEAAYAIVDGLARAP
jgi:hypothetical protein